MPIVFALFCCNICAVATWWQVSQGQNIKPCSSGHLLPQCAETNDSELQQTASIAQIT